MDHERIERIWLWISTAMIAAFLVAITAAALARGVHPASHVETIDPLRVRVDTEFASPGTERTPDGRVRVVMVAELYRFVPGTVRVPAGVPVTWRATSPDVIHGLQVVGTNVNMLVAPGYVSQTTVEFEEPGEYLIVCNEYCGLAHHQMQGRLIVEAPP